MPLDGLAAVTARIQHLRAGPRNLGSSSFQAALSRELQAQAVAARTGAADATTGSPLPPTAHGGAVGTAPPGRAGQSALQATSLPAPTSRLHGAGHAGHAAPAAPLTPTAPTASTGPSAAAERGRMLAPVPGVIGSGFGMRTHPISGKRKMHSGADMAAPTGTPILATAPGKVVYSGVRGGYGNFVEIDHGNGVTTRYAHAHTLLARVGERVAAGERIATVGSTGYSTGPHLHFEVRQHGQPTNPAEWIRKG